MQLTKKELEDIQAQAELEAEEELKAEAKEKALAEAKEAIRKKRLAAEAPRVGGEGTSMVMINLGKHSDRITIDGRTYLNGRAYPLTKDQEATIKDMAFRTHLHQAELRGGKWQSDFYGKRPYNSII